MQKKYTNRAAFLLLVCMLALFAGTLVSCSSGARLERDSSKTPAGNVSRADPGYLQYLEKQSMLGSSADLAAVISGSGLAWRVPGSGPNALGLLRLADAWVHIHPQSVLTPGHAGPLGQLGGPVIWNALGKGGLKGMYVAPTGGSGALWDNERRKKHGDNEDVVAYQFARYLGKDEDYKMAAKSAVAFHGLLGGDLVPAGTGIGPDFFLATRDFRNYTGVYCMVEVPKALWGELPKTEEESQVLPLSAEQAAALEAKGLVPARLQQETLSYLPVSGWAATGEVRGVDGNLRRWVYRYFYGYKRPVLNWADPSAAARQILNGSVIRQVGMFGNAVSGFSVRPFIGLERFTPGSVSARPNPVRGQVEENALGNYTLAMEAATNLSRQARSYGGWSWQRDELPLPLVREFMEIGPDFVQDSVFSPGAEHALLTGNATLLRFMVDEALEQKIEFRRLVHSSADHGGVSYLLPHLRYLSSLRADSASFSDEDTRAVQAKTLLAGKLLAQAGATVGQLQSGRTIHPLYRPRVEAEPEATGHVDLSAGRPVPTAVDDPESELKVDIDGSYREAALKAAAENAARPVIDLAKEVDSIAARLPADGAEVSEQAGGVGRMNAIVGGGAAGVAETGENGDATRVVAPEAAQAAEGQPAKGEGDDDDAAAAGGLTEEEADAISPQAGPDSPDNPESSGNSSSPENPETLEGTEGSEAPGRSGGFGRAENKEIVPEAERAGAAVDTADASSGNGHAVAEVAAAFTPAADGPLSGASAVSPEETGGYAAALAPAPGVPALQDDGERLFLTPAGIAAAALGLDVNEMRPHEYTRQDKDEIERGHSLLVFFKAMQPGVLMLSGQDLVGLMPLTWHSMYNSPEQWSPHLATLGTFPLLGSSQSVQINAQGLPRGDSLYGPLDVQSFIPDSFLNKTGALLRMRDNLGISEGEFVGRLKGNGSGFIAMVTRLPGGKGYAVSISNFSRNDSAESLQTRQIPGLSEAIRNGKLTVLHGELKKRNFNHERLAFTITGWEGALILVEPK